MFYSPLHLTFSVSTSQISLLDSFPLCNLIPASPLLSLFYFSLLLPPPLPFSSLSYLSLYPYQITVQKSRSESQKFLILGRTFFFLNLTQREFDPTLVTLFTKFCNLSAHNSYRCVQVAIEHIKWDYCIFEIIF